MILISNPAQEKPIRRIDGALTLVKKLNCFWFLTVGRKLRPIFSAFTAARCLLLGEKSPYSSAYMLEKLNEGIFQSVTDDFLSLWLFS